MSTAQPVKIRNEFIIVECELDRSVIYTDLFMIVPPISKETGEVEATSLSVLIVGLDSVSRAHMHRSMPRTVGLLREMGMIDLNRHNRLGSHTFPNLVGLLNGNTVEELESTCWPSSDTPFDDCHFLWDECSRYGYLTAFGEDMPSWGTFVYTRPGFVKQPTDYYLMPAFVAARDTSGRDLGTCFGSRRQFDVLLDYAVDLKLSLQKQKLFGLFWSSSSTHEWLGKTYWMDEIVFRFLTRIRDHLNDTVLVLMSDHGLRIGEYREHTLAGRIEVDLPFTFLVFPEWYRKLRPRAFQTLLRNSERLTTHFDTHETLKSLLPAGERIIPSTGPGKNLFTEELSPSRTCEEAGIIMDYCVTWTFTAIDDDESARRFGSSVVRHMNPQMKEYPQCAELSLDRVSRLASMRPPSDEGAAWGHFQVALSTLPGGGTFEAHVTVSSRSRDPSDASTDFLESELAVAGITRVNKYGNQSHCVNEYELLEICYCL